ncbi:MAG: hybrid sensor histidine kinase/response regulator, partial [Pseudomonadota bacterium]|nr:hybrid sensor histidine kinase/response regulator [Pseudomonadota bacterium]
MIEATTGSMFAQVTLSPSLLLRARADQVATLYGQWHRTTLSMALGAALLCIVLWQEASASAMALWIAAIVTNQAWRGALVALYRRAAPVLVDAPRWGMYWSAGSAIAGGLWGVAAMVMFPVSHAHQALLIVCIFGVVLGGLNLTAVYKPAFYGFVVTALVPLVVRVAMEADQVHLFTALVMLVVLVFVLTYGHHLNNLLTQSLAMRYENTDLIGELTAQTAAAEQARSAAETANRAKSQFLAAASHDLRQPLHAMGLFAAALAARACEPSIQPLVRSIHASVEALEALFGQLLDLSRLEAGALHPRIEAIALQPLFSSLIADFTPLAHA